jgi:hypothetical protein
MYRRSRKAVPVKETPPPPPVAANTSRGINKMRASLVKYAGICWLDLLYEQFCNLNDLVAEKNLSLLAAAIEGMEVGWNYDHGKEDLQYNQDDTFYSEENGNSDLYCHIGGSEGDFFTSPISLLLLLKKNGPEMKLINDEYVFDHLQDCKHLFAKNGSATIAEIISAHDKAYADYKYATPITQVLAFFQAVGVLRELNGRIVDANLQENKDCRLALYPFVSWPDNVINDFIDRLGLAYKNTYPKRSTPRLNKLEIYPKRRNEDFGSSTTTSSAPPITKSHCANKVDGADTAVAAANDDLDNDDPDPDDDCIYLGVYKTVTVLKEKKRIEKDVPIQLRSLVYTTHVVEQTVGTTTTTTYHRPRRTRNINNNSTRDEACDVAKRPKRK